MEEVKPQTKGVIFSVQIALVAEIPGVVKKMLGTIFLMYLTKTT